MPNEFMPFVVLRAPKPIYLKNEKTKPVKVVSDSTLLNSWGLIDNDKEKVYRNAEQYFNKNKTQFDLDNLPIRLNSFINWYDTQRKPLKNDVFLESITGAFKNEISSLASSHEFKQSKEIVTKGLILSSILDKNVEFIKPLMLRAFKFIVAFETLSNLQTENPAEDFQTLLQRTLLLPKEVFPVNFESAELQQKKKDFIGNQAKYTGHQQKEIKEKTEKFQQYEKAIHEIIETFDAHVNRLHEKPKVNANMESERTATILNAEVKPVYNNLDKDAIDALSRDTKAILKKENFSLDSINVPVTINRLENTSKKFYNDLVGIKKPYTNQSLEVGIDQVIFPVPGQCAISNEPEISTPAEDFPPKKGNGHVHNMYKGDLQKVRQTLKRYELGEIAAIENVMIGETRIAKYRQLQKVEESVTTEMETTQDSQKELQTNDQFQLQTQSSKTISDDRSKDAGITVTASYGSVTATATGNIAAHNASEESRNTSTNFASDVIHRSLDQIKERVFKQIITKTTSETEKKQEHSFDNTREGSEHINGVYRWVNKIYEIQVINYGLRQFLEFIIPDPAGFYRFAVQNKPVEGMTTEKPEKPGYCFRGIFKPLEPKDLNEYNYMDWVGRLNVTDIESPPTKLKTITFNKSFSAQSSSSEASFITSEETNISVPKNYAFLSGSCRYEFGRANVFDTGPWDSAYYSILIGNQEIQRLYFTRRPDEDPSIFHSYDKIPVLTDDVILTPDKLIYLSNDSDGQTNLTVSVAGFGTLFTINIGIQLLFMRTESSYEQWQINTYNKIMTSYNDLLNQYNRELENKQFSVFTSIQGRNPLINRDIEKTELKKLCLSEFTGQNYESFHLMTETDPITGYPQLNYENTYPGGKYIQFFENAFEWQNMTYVFYDYYWSNKKDWPGILSISDTDPLFEKFLKAGAARVQIPIRPGFELPVFNFSQFLPGSPWDGTTDAPLIDGHQTTLPYLSMLEEIKAQMNVDFEIREGTITVEEGKVFVTGQDTNFRAQPEDWYDDDIDREIIINEISYRIASVESPEHITLRQPFKKLKPGETTENIGYYTGGKFVGEPWEILVPTELVYVKDYLIQD